MKQEYQLQILTPVHIGTGEVLNPMDGYYANGRWYHIDFDKVLEHPSTNLNALTTEMGRRDFRWQRYLQHHNMDPAELSVYSLPCSQSPEASEIREAIHTIGNRPYIPGSTLKGAIRTAMLAEILDTSDPVYERSLAHLEKRIEQGPRGNPRSEQPARTIEQTAFGKDPNHDLLRALHIGDTFPIGSDALEIGLLWTLTLDQNDQLVQKRDNGREYKHFVKQFRREEQLRFSIKIDENLFRNTEKQRLGFNDLQVEKLHDIAEVCRSDADALLRSEAFFFTQYNRPEIANVYDKLIRINETLSEGAFLLQIGWGTGYHANTVTSLFTEVEEATVDPMDVRKRFRLGESRSRRGHYDERAFPKTRRILYRGQNPIAPMGWVKISPVEA